MSKSEQKTADHKWLDPICVEHGCQTMMLENYIEHMAEALLRIEQWSEAYPTDVFPEPDFNRANELLRAGGMSLDAISASIGRRTVERVGRIAKDALMETRKTHDIKF